MSRNVNGEGKNKVIRDLQDAIQNSWDAIYSEYCKNLINSMPDRIFEVIKTNGDITKH